MKTPYKPREVSKIDADIFRELIFSKRLFPAFPKEASKKIHFLENPTSESIEKKFSFSFKIGQQKVDLSFELKPESPLLSRLSEVGGLESLPEEFRMALMTYATREIITTLEHLFQLPVALWDAAKDKEETVQKKELYFEILDENFGSEADASISLSLPLIERVLDTAKKIPVFKSYSVKGAILQGEILIGSTTVSLDEWKSLRPGDLIVIQEPSALTTGEGRCLLKKSGIIPIQLKPDLLKSLVLPLEKMPLLLQRQPREKTDSSSTFYGKTAPLPTSLPISLELNFSAGLLSLTIHEAIQLNKTKTLEKPFPISRPLKIFIQEKMVGTGELVNINGRYALAVVALYSQY